MNSEIVELDGKRYEKFVCDPSTIVYKPLEPEPKVKHGKQPGDKSKPSPGRIGLPDS